jgi:uncharacterized membrane protein YhhN
MNEFALRRWWRAISRVDRVIALAALLAPVVYLLLLWLKPYPGDVAIKTSMCVLLALLAWRCRNRVLAVALLFSALGDALLGFDAAQLFVPALASFLVTHLLYAALFVTTGKLRFVVLSQWRRVLWVLVPLFAIGYTLLLWPTLANLAVPVAGYIAAIMAMTVLSLRMPGAVVPTGAVLFMLSDSLIALDKFLWQASWISPMIWITYAAAQLLIACGIIMSDRKQSI